MDNNGGGYIGCIPSQTVTAKVLVNPERELLDVQGVAAITITGWSIHKPHSSIGKIMGGSNNHLIVLCCYISYWWWGGRGAGMW